MNTSHILERVGHTASELSYSPYKDLSPIEYYGLITDSVNFNHTVELSQALEHIELPSGVIIGAIGSDGKLEQHAQSKTELIVVEESVDLNGDEILRRSFGTDLYQDIFETGPNGTIETKILASNDTFSYFYGDDDLVYPDIVLNMHPLYPITQECLNIYFRARERVLIEMSANKRIRDKMKTQLRSYRRTIQTGEYGHTLAFNPDKHVQYYSEKEDIYTLGFKIPFLRTVQRKLDLLTLQLNKQKTWREVSKEIPTTTIGRLNYLAQAGVIAPGTAAATGEAYAWFLQQYHHIQEDYKTNGTPTEIPYVPEDFARYSHAISNFVTP